MSYQAIARKWRPSTFEDIAGQGHVTRTLQNALTLKRIHHAFLFTGARGVGKTTAARTFARSLNCAQGPTPTPCGECASCHEVPIGNSADVVEIDGASNNSVDDVRELRDAVRYLPQRDRYRIYIIDEVHMLSIGAFNALLKTLEEPPPHVIFIFATTEPQKIPDTILSRVQRFDFKRIPVTTVVKYLANICSVEGISIPEDGLRLIARAGEGSMRDAQSLLDQVIAFGGDSVETAQVAELLGLVDRGLLHGFLAGLVQGRPEDCLDAIAQVYDYGYEISQFTTEILELLRNAALTVLSPQSHKHLDVPEDEKGRLAEICKDIDAETFSRWFSVMLGVHDEVSRSNRPRLVLEMAVARLATVRPLQPVDHLVTRLHALEKRLRDMGVQPQPATPRSSARAPGQSSARESADDKEADPGRPAPPPLKLAPPAPEPSAPEPGPPVLEDEAPPWATGVPVEAQAPAPSPAPLPDAAPDPDPDPDDTPETEPGLPTLIPGLDGPGRFKAMARWLRQGHVRFRPIAEHSAFLGREGRELRLCIPRDMSALLGRELAQDAELRRIVDHFFPGISSFRFEERQTQERPLTSRESRDKRVADYRKELWDEANADPKILGACEVLGARITQVEPLSLPEDP